MKLKITVKNLVITLSIMLFIYLNIYYINKWITIGYNENLFFEGLLVPLILALGYIIIIVSLYVIISENWDNTIYKNY